MFFVFVLLFFLQNKYFFVTKKHLPFDGISWMPEEISSLAAFSQFFAEKKVYGRVTIIWSSLGAKSHYFFLRVIMRFLLSRMWKRENIFEAWSNVWEIVSEMTFSSMWYVLTAKLNQLKLRSTNCNSYRSSSNFCVNVCTIHVSLSIIKIYFLLHWHFKSKCISLSALFE